MAISKRLRFEILRRDNHACKYCGQAATPDRPLTIDHVVPVALGGSDDPSNLVAACRDCNSGKSSVPAGAPLVADVAQDAMRWAAAMKRAAADAQADREQRIDIERAVLEMWQDADYYGKPYSNWLPDDWYLSVQRWSEAGLTKEDMLEACHITIYARRKKPTYDEAWKYFCGICWRMLTERQEAARKLIGAAVDPAGEEVQHCTDSDCMVHARGALCVTCRQGDCTWYCGYYAGATRMLNTFGPLGEYGAALARELSIVCDGALTTAGA